MALGERVTVNAQGVALFQNPDASRLYHVKVKNLDATNAVDVGGSGVAANGGFPLPAGATQDFYIGPDEAIYATPAAGSPQVAVWASLWSNAESL